MSKGGVPAAPDYTPIASANLDAAKLQEGLGRDQLAWAKQQYADTAPDAKAYLKSMTAATNQQMDNATTDRARYENLYQPLENKFLGQANDWNSAARAEQQAGAARADVAASFDQARTTAQASLESYGIDPSTTRFGALDLSSRVSQAAGMAAAGTQSRLNTQGTGLALEGEGINIGKGYPGQVSQSYAGATNAGSSGVTSALNTSSTYGNLMGTAPQYEQLASGNRAGATQALNTGFQNQMAGAQLEQQRSSSTSAGIGSLVGIAAMGAIAI